MTKRSSKQYEVKFTQDGIEDIQSLPKKTKGLMRKDMLERLVPNPYSCSTELREPLGRFRSFHVREYRIIFALREKLIVIVAVGKRLPQSSSDVYKRLAGLAREGRLAEKILKTLRILT